MTTHENRRPKAPWCWQEKNNLRYIRSLVKKKIIKKSEGRNILDVFRAMTEFLSDHCCSDILVGTNLAKRLGGYALMGADTVKKTLHLMETHQIIRVFKTRNQNSGQYGASQIELLAPPIRWFEFEDEDITSSGDLTTGENPSDGDLRGGQIHPHVEETLRPKEEALGEERILPQQEIFKRSKRALQCAVEEVIGHLNLSTGRSHDPQESSTRYLRERLIEGAEIADCIVLIDHRIALWQRDPKMNAYLRPSTLFSRNHFGEYLELARQWDQSGRPTLQPAKHQQTASVAPTGAQREEWIAQWRQLSK